MTAHLSRADAQPLPSYTRPEAEKLGRTAEFPGGQGSLLLVHSNSIERDPRDRAPYKASWSAYIRENEVYRLRFQVLAQDEVDLGEAKLAATLLAAIWSAADSRFGRACALLRSETVRVWLSRSGEAGGEQFRNNLYVYDLLNARTPLEWARELAHEYGHYLLPSASGFTEPESWANGALGERLFLKWLLDDLRAGKLQKGEHPYIREEDLRHYSERQTDVLLARAEKEGVPRASLEGTSREAFDAFSSLMLAIDRIYGPAMYYSMLDHLPRPEGGAVSGERFLEALAKTLRLAGGFRTLAPRDPGRQAWLPAGRYLVRGAGEARLSISGAQPQREPGGGWRVEIPSAGWRRVIVTGDGREVLLEWERL